MCEEKRDLKERLGAIMKNKKRGVLAVCVSAVLIIALTACAVTLGAGSGGREADEQIPVLLAVTESGESYAFQQFSYTNGTAAVDTIAPWDAEWDESNTITVDRETKFDINCAASIEDISDYAIHTADGAVYDDGTLWKVFSRLTRITQSSDGTYTIFTPSEPGSYYYNLSAKFTDLSVNYAVKIIVIDALSEPPLPENRRQMTLDDVRDITQNLARYGTLDILMKYLSDTFIGEDIGSGFWIMRFDVEGGEYQLTAHQAGGLRLVHVADGASVDLLYFDLDAFLAGEVRQIRETPPPMETTAPTYDPDFTSENSFEVKPNPDRYTPTMSSYPGILLGYGGQASGKATMRYDCESGNFLYWEGDKGVITNYGKTAEEDFGGLRLHWSPDDSTKDGDIIDMRLLDAGGAVTATVSLVVRKDGNYYSLEKSSPNPESPLSVLETAVSQAIISNAGTSPRGGYQTESHVTLKVTDDGNVTTVYAYALSLTYIVENGKLTEDGGSSMPVAITFSKNETQAYSLSEYWTPQSGSYYPTSIQNKFPRDLWDKVDTQLYANDCTIDALRKAQRHFGFTDYTKPEIAVLKPLEVPKGTKPDWNEYFSITDDIDGLIPVADAYCWDVPIDFDTPGKYILQIIVRDKACNENRSSYEVSVE
jgi:hypothetical protein